MNTPDLERLRQMSYSELKKIARLHGIKTNMKAKKIIATILDKYKNENESFFNCEQKIINSSKKNKEAKFDEDKETVSETPRRETYTIYTPVNDNLPISKEVEALTASPFLGNLFMDATPGSVRISRGSKRKLKDHKVSFITPVKMPKLNTSLSTPKYMSLKDRPKTPIPQKSSAGKRVSFTTPNRKKGKESLSQEGRKSLPTTPHPSTGKVSNPLRRRSSRISGNKRVSFTTPNKMKSKESVPQERKKTVPTTPHPNTGRISNPSNSRKSIEMKSARPPTPMPKDKVKDNKTGMRDQSVDSRTRDTPKSTKILIDENSLDPISTTKRLQALVSDSSGSSVKRRATPNSTAKRLQVLVSNLNESSVKRRATPNSATKQLQALVSDLSQSLVKRRATPNFKKIHEKAFEKMESIDDYQKRKAINSAKKIGKPLQKTSVSRQVTSTSKVSKIPKSFGGIPFIPSVKSCNNMKLDFSGNIKLRQNLVSSVEMKKAKTRSVSQNESCISKKTDKPGLCNITVSKENIPAKRKIKFDLKASLSRKLPYKPHVGPLKPLSEMSLNTSINSASHCFHQKNETRNEVVLENRSKSRDVLHGVRKNRRFELQMKNRK